VAHGVQVSRERRRDIRESPGLGQRRHLGAEQTHREPGAHCGGLVRRAMMPGMRRVLIGLTVAVLLVLSVSIGVVVARWPLYPHLWP